MERKITIFLLALLSLYLSPSFCLFLSSLVLSLSFISLSLHQFPAACRHTINRLYARSSQPQGGVI